MPNTLTGLAEPPTAPTGVCIRRIRADRVHPQFINCNVIYSGHDGETHWWTPIPVIDTWIDPQTDRILHDQLPPNTGIRGKEGQP